MTTTSPFDTGPFEAFEASGWEQQAAGYERFFRPITVKTADALLDAAGVAPSSHVLDVGTGPGHVAGHAMARGASAVGIDISAAMVDGARALFPGARFEVGDAHQLPFADGSFDAVTGNFVLLHLGRPEQAVREMARVVRQGGRIAVTVWDEPARTPLLGAVVGALAASRAEPPADLPAGPPFFRFADERELRDLLEGAGLTDVTITTPSFTHVVGEAEEVWAGLMAGTVRTSALVLRQPPALQRRIHDAFIEILEAYRRGATIALPVSVKLAAGLRPA